MCAQCDVIAAHAFTLQPFCYGICWRFGTWSNGAALCESWRQDVKINGKYYRETLLKKELLPDMRNISEYFIFQQDNAPAHRAKETVDLLLTETPAFILPTLWPPDSPDLNPVDYKVWSVLRPKQKQVYKVKVNNVDELRQRIQTVWDELAQCIIDKAIKQWWRTCLRACKKAEGGHFEHKL